MRWFGGLGPCCGMCNAYSVYHDDVHRGLSSGWCRYRVRSYWSHEASNLRLRRPRPYAKFLCPHEVPNQNGPLTTSARMHAKHDTGRSMKV